MDHLTIRLATLDDSQALFAWRNDPVTRAASHNTEPISPEEHHRWIHRLMAMGNHTLFIAESNGRPVGTVRVSTGVDYGKELSWTVAPEERGKRIAKRMVWAIADATPEVILATIKQGNFASMKVAEHCRMKVVRQSNGLLHYRRPSVYETLSTQRQSDDHQTLNSSPA